MLSPCTCAVSRGDAPAWRACTAASARRAAPARSGAVAFTVMIGRTSSVPTVTTYGWDVALAAWSAATGSDGRGRWGRQFRVDYRDLAYGDVGFAGDLVARGLGAEQHGEEGGPPVQGLRTNGGGGDQRRLRSVDEYARGGDATRRNRTSAERNGDRQCDQDADSDLYPAAP